MPNWVYSGIEVTQPLTKKQLKIVDKIEKAGSICQYYKPQPLNLSNICTGAITINGKKYNKWRRKLQIDGTRRDVPVTPEELIILKERYGYTDWYHWSLDNWNTKWGDCRLEVDIRDERTKHFEKIENKSEVPFLFVSFTFESAWSPICDSILEMFAKDFPSFNYWYEEECEWGGIKTYDNGVCCEEHSYDEPNWDEEIEINHKDTSCNAVYLREDHPSYDYGKGYYEEYSKNSFLGKTIEEAKNTLAVWSSK
tara:strand:- start:1068 stop:1826 length:759 start_codon:yes stop_codon:yes gene_type:complete